MKVNIKKLEPNASIPKYANRGDAGADIFCTSHEFEINGAGIRQQVYGTGLALEIPEGYVGLIFPRSSITKTALTLGNAVGVIDSNFRGEVKLKFNIAVDARVNKASSYAVGDRIGQLIIIPCEKIAFNEVDELGTTERGEGSFGSTGV